MLRYFLIASLALTLTACLDNDSTGNTQLTVNEQVSGRGHNGKRPAVYRMKAPVDWVRRDPLPGTDLSDTTLSIADFFIVDDDGSIRIAIHNFPSRSLEERIPPAAQVARWERQFKPADETTLRTEPLSFSGYKGLYFQGTGLVEGVPTAVAGWSLQLADEHYHALTPAADTADPSVLLEMRSDVTIKASGLPHLMEKHKNALNDFALSFELIEEIPTK